MRSVCFVCLAVFVVVLENVAAQDYTDFFKRLNSLRNPVFINSRTGHKTYYEGRDLSSRQSRSSEEEAPRLRIDVYYETNCPDSMRFITRQLYPLYQEMGDTLDIHFHPYGKAYRYFDEEKKRHLISCQHGPSECYGNTVQACALKLYPNTDDHLNFINCMENYPKPSDSGQKCARRHSLEWEKIEKCAKGEMGERLLHEQADLTESLNPKVYFVPWVIFDNVFDEGDFRRAVRGSLKRVVCKRYKGHHAGCDKA